MRYNEPKRGLLSRLAEAGSAGLGIASNMAMPMYQQKMAQQRDQRDFDAEQQRFNQRMGQDQAQFDQTMALNRDRIPEPKAPNVYNPPTAEAAWVNAQMNGNTALANTFYKAMMEKNTYEDRQATPKNPSMPPNLINMMNEGFGNEVTKWQNDYVLDETTDNPNDYRHSGRPEPTKKGYFDRNWGHAIPNYQQSYPQSFGPNAADSLYQGFTGQPRLPKTGPFTHVNTTPGAVVQMGDAPQPYDGNGTPEEYQQYLRDWQAAYQRRQR